MPWQYNKPVIGSDVWYFITLQVDRSFQEATEGVEQREAALDSVAMSISFLKKLTPHAVGACRSLTCMYIPSSVIP